MSQAFDGREGFLPTSAGKMLPDETVVSEWQRISFSEAFEQICDNEAIGKNVNQCFAVKENTKMKGNRG